jgi:hypothetical protein
MDDMLILVLKILEANVEDVTDANVREVFFCPIMLLLNIVITEILGTRLYRISESVILSMVISVRMVLNSNLTFVQVNSIRLFA